MQKKLEAELMSLAHSILKLKKGDDVNVLKNKAHQVYEKLSVLSFIDKYVKETPQNNKSVAELIEETFEPKIEPVLVSSKEEIKEKDNQELELAKPVLVTDTDASKVEGSEEENKNSLDLLSPKEVTNDLKNSLNKEFENTISLDVATDIFEKAERVVPKKSINDVIMQQKNLQIDLNDRIAFVKNLFNDSQEDFNRVISQLNSMSSEKEASSLMRMVKKEYNWDGKEVFEERLLMLIERKFN